jgi:exodeoxyribonuclease VII large subunit
VHTHGALERAVRRSLDRERERLRRSHTGLERGTRRALERDAHRLAVLRDRLRRGPALLLERRRGAVDQAGARLAALSPRGTLERGYAIVRAQDRILRSAAEVGAGDAIEVELAEGALRARVEETRP